MTKFLLMFLLVVSMNISAQTKKASYTVRPDGRNGHMNVEACFPGHNGTWLTSGRQRSSQFLRNSEELNVRRYSDSSYIYLPTNRDCVHYSVDLNKAARGRQARKYNNSWLINNQAWLWRPRERGEFSLKFEFPEGQNSYVSVPWQSTTEDQHFIAGRTPVSWTSRMLFGDVHVQQIITAGTELQLAIIGVASSKKRQEIGRWIKQAADAVSSIYGRFPVNNAQVIVAGIGKRREAVPWGEVQRAGSASVHLFVDETRPIEEYIRDWTAVHELSHLLIPRIDYRDRWLSEGIASYYQNVARMDVAMLTPSQAWQKLNAGFTRGRIAQNGNLRQSRSTMHTYWGGAAYYLLADLRLRALPTPTTLPEVLGKLRACCMPSDDLWSAETFVAKLDELSGGRVFTSLLKNQATHRQFPVERDFVRKADAQTVKNLNAIFQNNFGQGVTND